MSALAIKTMSRAAIDRVREVEKHMLAQPQTPITTHHVIHGGMYARTICIPAGVGLTGAEIQIATMLVINGHVRVATGDDNPFELTGYHVIPASRGRKQAFLALADTHITMLFPTAAKTVEQAENEFTHEAERLFSRHGENVVTITEET